MFNRKTDKRLMARAGVVIALVTASVAVVASPAAALGNNRVVYRSCGENWVGSGRRDYSADWMYYAQTIKEGGDCGDRLSAGLRAASGYTFPRVYGDEERVEAHARVQKISSNQVTTGMHWGCDSCGVTYS